ncbi:MAG: nucleotidyltransferase family protein [Bacteroidota bacterium]|nr:nucleotidyltransferase family protein [Bacteroidota bacterium]
MNPLVNTKKELIDLIVANSEQINLFGVQRIGIFGSFVRDEAQPESDIDFFVDIKSEMKTLGNFIELGEFLENLTGRKVELITPQSLSKYIGPHILKEVEYVNFAA